MKYFCLALLLVGSTQLNGNETPAPKKEHADALNQAFAKAVTKNQVDEVKRLIEAGADVLTPISYTWTDHDWDLFLKETALLYATRYNLPDLARVLLQVEQPLDDALSVGITRGRFSIVKELIDAGAEINKVNKLGEPPLIRAVGNPKIVQLLLTAGANVTDTDKRGETALMKAVIFKDIETVKNLLQVPAMTTGSFFGFGTKPLNYANEEGNTALILAMREAHRNKRCQEIVKILLQTPGIDVHHANKNGETAITLFEKLKNK